jgi:3-isopropylmalate/(R)-2-methylmalate dehydratase large subunit
VRVPESLRIELRGSLGRGVAAKDVMLHLLSLPLFRSGEAIGKVLEFAGEGLRALSLDERATLANMAVEGGGFTGIVPCDEVTAQALASMRALDPSQILGRAVRPDAGAQYAAVIELELAAVEPMVALPGDPRNGIALRELEARMGGPVPIQIAYGGSCTGGKRADMDMYASVLARALEQGLHVAQGVELYIQFGSQLIRRYAEERGYLDIFNRVGAKTIEPSCGACIRAGPGVSRSPEQVTVSAVNRNYPGRSGPGKVYLASPLVVAASAIAGKIAPVEALA